MEQISSGFKRLSLSGLFFLFGISSLFAQTVAVNTTTHQTLTQTQILVNFTPAGGATGLAVTGTVAQQNALWTVRIDPDGAGPLVPIVVPVTSVLPLGLNLLVTFDATAMPTHGAGRPFIMPGETMTVQYAGGVGAGAIKVVPGVNFVPAIAARPSVNNAIFTCADLIFFNQGDYAGVNLCSPVVMNFHQFQYKLSLRMRNSSAFVTALDGMARTTGTQLFYQMAWGDAAVTNVFPYISDLAGVSNPIFIDNAGFTGATPAIVMTARPIHNYPAPNPGDCTFDFSALPVWNGVAACPGLTSTNPFATYDNDNTNSGVLNLPPSVVGTDKVCIGNNVNMRFTDLTALNCRLAIEPIKPNDQARFIRIKYGSTNFAAPGNIPDIFVTPPAAFGVGITQITNNNATGTFILPNWFPTGAGGVGIPDFNGVIQLATPVTVSTATAFMGTITTALTNMQVVGQRFYIQLDYWDICNAYNPVSPGAPAPVSIQNFVEIVPKPAPLTAAGLSLCFANPTVATNFTVGGVVGGVTAINFYNKNPRGPGPIQLMQSSVSPNFSTANYTVGNLAIGAPYSTNNAAGKYFSVWATQVVGATNNCESDPIEVVIYQQPDLSGNVPANPTGLTPVCNGPPGNAQTYNEATVPPINKTIPITTATNAAAINFLTENLWSIGFGAGVTFAPATGNSTVVTYNIVAQPNPSVTANVSVRLRYQAQFVSVVSPNPAPNNVPTYTIAAQICQSNNANLSVTVFGQTNGGAVAPNATVCLGSTTGVMTLAGQRGTILRWERTVNAGAPVNIGNAGLTTYSEITANGPGTYTYYAVIQNGPCAVVNSTVATITVNTVPPQPTLTIGAASIPGGPNICDDGIQQVVLQSSNIGGVGVRFDFYKNAVLVQTGPGSTFTVNNVPESGTYTVQVFGIAPSNCASPLSLPRVITVNPLPTAANPTGGGAVCSGNPAPDIQWVLTGTAPFTLTVTRTPGVPLVTGSATNTFTIVAPNPGVATTYQITSLSDANGCIAAGGTMGSAASVTIGGTAPTFDTAPTLSPISTCDAGGATPDPTLLFSLDPGSANLVGVVLTYKVDGSANRTKTFNTNAAGDPSVPMTFNDPELNLVVPSPHSFTVVSILTPAGCLSVFNTPLTFTVNPLPVLVNGQVKTICSGQAVNYEVLLVPANTPAGTLFNWPLPTMSGGPAQGTTGVNVTADPLGKLHITDVLTNTTGAAITATYNITPTSAAGCAGTLKTVVVTVNPEPVLVVGQATTICSGQSANYEILLNPLNLPAGTVFNWPAPVMSAGAAQGTAGVNVAMGVAGTKHILDVLTNTTGVPITATYTITPKSGAPCNGTARTVVVTINPAPALVAGQVTTICSGQSANYEILLSPLNLPAGTVFSWAAPIMSAGPAQGTAGVNVPMGVAGTKHITDILTNTTGAAITATYTIIPTSGALCVGAPRTVVVTVNAAPNLVAGQTKSICNNSAVNYEILLTPANLPAGTVFNWPLPVMSAGGAQGTVGVNKPMGVAGTLHITDVLVNNGVVPITATYTITPSSTLTGCVGAPRTVVVTINPTPVANAISGQSTVCSGLSIILYQVVVHAGSLYSWTIDPAFSVFGGGGTNSPNFFVLLQFASTGTHNISVVEQNAFGCSGAANVFPITVAASPVAIVITGPTEVCQNDTGIRTYSVPLNAGSTYAWTVPAGASIVGPSTGVGLNSVTVNFGVISPITIGVSETNASGCTGAPTSIIVNVNPKPVITSSSTSTVCSGGTPGLVFTSSVPSTFSWKVTSITGPITGTAVGNSGAGNLGLTFTGAAALKNSSGAVGSVSFDVTPTATAIPNCPGSVQSLVLSVNPEPLLVSAQTKTVCSNQPANYEILLTPLNLPAGTIFNWAKPTMSDATIQGSAGVNVPGGPAGTLHITDVLVNTSNSPITATYTITPTSGLGCVGAAKTVVITVNPEPIMSAALDATRCSDTPIGLTLATAAGSTAANNYNITARAFAAGLTPAGTNAAIPANGVATNYLANDSYNNVTTTALIATYTVVPVSVAGCIGAPKIITLTINPEPVLSNALDVTICSGLPSGLNLNTIVSSVGALNYNVVGKTVAAGLVGGGTNASIPANGVAANYLANDTYTNTGNASLTVVYQVVAVSAGGCPGNPPIPITATILPEPVVSSSLNASVCSRTAIGLTLNTNGTSIAAGNYNITGQLIDPGLTAGGANVAVPAVGVVAGYLSANVYTNTGNSPLNVAYTVVPKSAVGCLGASKVITITINPEPVMSNALDKTVCSDVGTGLLLNTNGASVAAANYNITARSISAGLTPNIANAPVPFNNVAANYLAADAFTNLGALPLTVTYTVVPVSGGACIGSPKVITVTINPEPVVSNTLDGTVCSSVVIGLTLNTNGSSVAATTYNITNRTMAAGLTAGGGNAVVPINGVAAGYLANDIYSNTGAASLAVTYTVVPISAAGCLGDPKVVTLTVTPEPVMSNALDASVCSNVATGLTLNTNGVSIGAANYNITARAISAGLTAAGTNAVVPFNNVSANYLDNDKFSNTGASPLTVTYTVVPKSASGCPGPAKAIIITVNPEPVVSNTLNATVCSDIATGLTLATNGASVAAASYNITARAIAAGLTPAAGNASVPAPGVAANFLAADAFTNTGPSSLTVTYTVVPVSAAGCTGAAKVVTITINPEPVVSGTLNTSVCSTANIGLTLATNGISVGAASYNITALSIPAGLTAGGGNAAVPFNGVAPAYLVNDVYTNTGAAALNVTYTVVPVSGTGCLGDPKVITITINPQPVVSNTLDATICSDIATGLTLNTIGTSVAAANYNITARSIAAGLTPAVTNVVVPAAGAAANYLVNDKFTNLGALPLAVTYTVVPVSAAGCVGASKVITITVSPEPVVSSSLNTNICSDVATGLILATNGTSVAAANYNITARSIAAGLIPAAGNAVVSATGVAANYLAGDKFTNTGAISLPVTYTVVPVSVAGCLGDPKVVTISIDPEPVVSSALDATVCSDAAIGLILNTNGTSVAATSYNFTLRVLAGGLVAGGANVAVPVSGVAANYAASDTYTNTGAASLTVTYTVVPVSAGGCLGDPKVITITISPKPVVSNTLNATACSSTAIGLVLNTNGTSVAASNYNITAITIAAGLTAAGTNVAVPAVAVAAGYLGGDKFTNTGATPLTVSYTVVPISAAGCVGVSKVIIITINPEPALSASLDATICSGVATGLTLATNGTSIAAANYNITARSIAAGLTPAAGNAVVSATGIAANYLAGDKFTNTGAVPLTVTYTVVPVSAAGCAGVAKVVTLTINPEPVVSGTLDATACSGANIGLTLATNGTSVGAAGYNITAQSITAGLIAGGGNAAIPFNGAAAAYLANDFYTNTTAVALDVTYTVVPVSAAGCLGAPKVITIAINPQPVVSNTLDATICSDVGTGLTLTTTGTSVAAASYDITARSIPVGLTAAATNVAVPAPGVAANYLINDKFTNQGAVALAVTYTVVPKSAPGCQGAPKVITITVNPEPVVSGTLNANTCSDVATGLTLATNGTSVAAANYNVTARTIAAGLTPAAGNVSVGVSGVAANYLAGDKFTNTGAVSLAVTYTVVPVSAAGCLGDPKVITMTIDPEPVVSGTLDASACSGANIGLTLATNGTSIGAATYNITARSIAAGLTAGGGNAPVPFNGVAAAYLANDVYTNSGAAVALNVTYTVVPVSATGCLGDPKVITISINPQPVVSNTLDATICSDVGTGLILNTTGTSVAAANYNITARSISVGLTAAATNVPVPAAGVAANYLINDKFTNPGAVTLAVTYTVVPISAGGCQGAPKVITITVSPEPVVSGTLNTNACSDVATGLTLATDGISVAAANYNVTARTIAAGLTPAAGNVVVGVSGVAANYLAGDKFTNTGAVSLAVTYTVVPVSAAGCFGDPKVITISIDPEPVVSSTLDKTVCSNTAIGLTLNTNGTSVAAANYNFTSRILAGGLVAGGANVAVPALGVAANYAGSDKFTNTGAASLTVTYTVVPISAAGCLGDPKVITITINPEPVVSVTLAATVCSDAIIGLTLATDGVSVAAANYNITALSISAGLTAAVTNVAVPATGVGAPYLNGDKYTNLTAAPLTVSYTVVPVSAGGCLGAPKVVVMTISPEPVLSGSLNLTQCSNVATALTLNTNGTSVAAQNYNITNLTVAVGLIPALGNAAVPAGGVNLGYLANDKFTNTGAVALTATYTIVPVSAAGCAGNPANVIVTINPEPVVSTTLNAALCSGIAIGLTLNTNGTSVAALNYNITNISVPGALTAGGANAIVPAVGVVVAYLANDVYTNTTASPLDVTYTVVPVSAAGCSGAAKIITISINPEPVVANGLNATICSDIAIGLTLNTNGSSVAAAAYNITIRTIDPALTPAGTNATVPSNGVPANYLAADKFTNTGATSKNVVYTVVPVSAAGCKGAPKVITFIINPKPVTANGLDAFICSHLPVSLTLNTNGSSVAAASYNIVSRTVAVGLVANGANVAVPAAAVAANYLLNDSFTNTTASSLTVTYVVAPVSAAGCVGDPKTITMTIRPEPVMANGLDGTRCSGIATGLTLNTNGSSVAAANYNVTVINVAPGLTPVAGNAVVANGVAPNYLAGDRFTNTGALSLNVVYTVIPVSGSGCLGAPKNITFTIDPEPVVSATLNATVCSDVATALTLNTNGTSVAAATYNITSVVKAPSLTAALGNAVVPAVGVAANYLVSDAFTNTTNASATVVYNVVAVSAGGCVGGPRAITITINPEPVLASGLNKTVCSGAAGGITLNTNGTSVAAANYNITSVTVPAGLTIVSAAAIPAVGVAVNYLATDKYTNNGNAPLDVLYTVVPVSAASCLGDPLVIKQTVNPGPVLGNLNKTVCSDVAIALTLNTNGISVAAANYNVTLVSFPAGLTAAPTNAPIPGAAVSATYLSNDQFTNLGNLPLDVHYTVVPVSAIGCLGNAVVVVITINPEPVVSNALNKTVCSDVVSGINLNTNGTSVAAANYNITSIVAQGGLIPKAGNAAVASGVATGYLAADVFTNKTNGSLTVTYTVVPVSGAGCLGDPLAVVLTVNPEPVMDPALATKTICSRDKTNITLNTNGSSVAAATFNISLVSQDAGLTGVPTTGAGLLATAILNDNFVNVTTVPLKVIYQTVPISAGGCLGVPFNIAITVNAEPVVNPALDNTVCSRDISGIILSTNGTSVAANSYQLVSVIVPGTITADPANTLPGASSGINLIKNDKYSNTTAAAVVVTYSVFGISPQNCQGQPQTIRLTVNPEPILTPGAANLCSDVPSGIILNPAGGSAPITQYQLKNIAKAAALIAGPTNAGLGTYNTNNFLAGDQFTNTTSGPLVVTYTIAPIAIGCTGTDQTVVFTVNPAPGVAGNLNRTVCTNDVSGIVFATETSPMSTLAASYNITAVTIQAGLAQTAGNTGVRIGVTQNEIQNDQFQNPTNNPLTVTYSVKGISGPGCLGPVKDIVLTIEPTIKATPVNNKPDICSNDVTNIDLISPTIPTSGSITFNYTAVSSVGGLISGFVPSASNLPANSKITDNLINNSASPATVTYTITPVANGAKAGSGCTGAAVAVVVIVEPKPKMVATPLISSNCEGSPTAIVLTTTTAPTAGTIHFNVVSTVPTGGMTLTSAAPPAFYINGQSITDVWNNPTNTAQTVTYTLLPVVSGGLGCVGDNVTITVNVNPLPAITNSAQAPICSNDFINITLTSNVANTINTWTAAVISGAATGAGPGAGDLIFQTLRNTGSTPATVRYTVTPKASNCLGTPLIIDVIVNPLADALIGLATQKVCFGGTLNVPLTSSVAGTTFSWIVDPFPNSMSVPQTGSGPVINQVLSNPTGTQDFLTYTITATGPGATACAGQPKVMTVIAAPQMNAQILNPATFLCKGSKDFLQIQLDGQAPFTLVYTDGTSNFTILKAGNFKSIQVQPNVTTTYSLVSLNDAFGCSLVPASQVTFTVGDTDATFAIVGAASSCSPYQVTLQYNQKAGTEYTWRWGDGVPDSIYIAAADAPGVTVKHTYVNTSPTGTLKPKIVLQTDLPAPFPGCFKSTTQTVNIFPTIITNVFPDKDVICSGELVRFTNQSFGVSATGNRWFFRVQGNVGQELQVLTTKNVSYTFTNTTSTNPIIYEVVYQATNGNCPAADVITPITVYRGVTAGFDEGTVPPLLGGHSLVTFTNTSVPIDPSQFRYDWDFGLDATPATANGVGPFPVDFTSPGPRDVVITATNIAAETAGLSCSSQFTKTINILLLPLVAEFKAIPVASCYPSQITVTENNSTGDVMEWRLIDNNGRLAATSNGDLPVFQVNAPGKYTLSLKTSSSITGQVAVAPIQTFTVYDKPLASFDVRPDIVYVPDTELTTFNFSFGATAYHWDFGDNGTSTDFQPTYTYKVEGKYDITLIASNDHDDGAVCADTLVHTVIAKQGGLTKVPNAFTPNQNGPNGGVSTNGSFNDVFLPIVKGVEEFNMQIYDRWGNLIFESNSASIGWDGYNKDGRLLPAGVYVYKLTVRLSDNQRSTQIGDVTMIR